MRSNFIYKFIGFVIILLAVSFFSLKYTLDTKAAGGCGGLASDCDASTGIGGNCPFAGCYCKPLATAAPGFSYIPGTCISSGTPPPTACSGPSGGPCSGTCPSGQVCRAATAQNGGACGCHPGGNGGGCAAGYHRDTSCKKAGNCGGGTVGSACGTDSQGKTKYNCTLCVPDACTAPAITSINRTSSTSLTVNWTPGTASTSQSIYIGSNQTQVTNNCPAGSTCSVVVTGLAGNLNTYTTSNVLAAGTVYFVKIYSAGSCGRGSPLSPYLSTCNVNPSSLNIGTNATGSLQTVINTDSSNQITQTTYSTSNGSIATATTPDTTNPYTTTVSSQNNPGSAFITSNVYFGATLACSGVAGVNVIPSGPWWQVKDSDVITNGDLRSSVPGSNYFGLAGPGGYPGVAGYGGNTNLTNTLASTNGWLANSLNLNTKTYDTNFFLNQIPADTVVTTVSSSTFDQATLDSNTTSSYGYYWFKYDGSATGIDLNIDSAIDVGNKKVVLMVASADLNINAPINLTDGQGFFMVAAGSNPGGTKGNIFVNPTVGGGGLPNLEGIYLADNKFETGTDGAKTDSQLYVRGSVVGYQGVTLERDLGDAANSDPAEFFEYAPDQTMLFPSKLSARRINWKEVAP